MDSPVLKLYRTHSYLQGTVDLVNKYKPEIVLMGATGLGRDLAGAVATDLKTGLTADCTQPDIDKKMRLLEQTRPAFGGNIMATILTETTTAADGIGAAPCYAQAGIPAGTHR